MVMARDKDGRLISRNAASQRVFDLSVDKIRRNWNLDPLSAIPDVDGLRPADLNDLSMDFVRHMALLSRCQRDVHVVQALMIEERDGRLASKNKFKEKDKRLKDGDVEAIYELYYKDQFHNLQDFTPMVHRHEANRSQVRAGKDHNSAPSTGDSDGCRTSDGSSSSSCSPLLRSYPITRPGLSGDLRFSRKRRENIDEHVSLPPTKRTKALITASAQAMALQRPSSSRPKAISTGLQKVSSDHQFGHGLGDEPWDHELITPRVVGEKSRAKEVVLSNAQLWRNPLELEERSLTYQHDVSRPTISPSSDNPMEQLASKPLTITVSTPRNPLHQMLDKITTGFTDNLFFIHGILRTYADVDTARARGEALDGAAADVLKSLDIFRKRVRRISEAIVEQPALAPIASTAATAHRPSKPPTTAGGQTASGAVHRTDDVTVDTPDTPQSARGCDDDPQRTCLREEQITKPMPLKTPLDLPTVDSNQGPKSRNTGAATVPRATYTELREELFVNPWSTETR